MPQIVIKDDEKGYDKLITAKKIAIIVGMSAALAGVQTLITSLTGLQFPAGSMETLYIGVLIAALKGIENYLKNRNI